MAGGHEVALQVHVDDRIEVILCHVDEHPIPQDAGVVDEDVQVTEVLNGGVDEALATFPVGDVIGVGHSLAAHGPNLIGHHLGCATVIARTVHRATEVVDHELGAFLGEEQGVLTTNAAACSGDDCYPSVQCTHDCLPLGVLPPS